MSKPKVFSYVRFSTPEQAMGDSERRQLESTRAWAKRKGYVLDEILKPDRGMSGYHGVHRKRGQLGRFLAMVRARDVPAGSILVVEKASRLGREGAYRTLKETVFALIEAGIVLQVLSPEITFDQAAVDGPLMHVLVALLQTAYQESKDKSDYSKRNWSNHRARARSGGLLCKRLPAWIEERNGRLRLIPDRAEVIRRIFAMAADGLGHMRILKKLTAEGVPAFGERKVRPGSTRSQFSGKWTRPYLALLLNDRRVLGELQPRLANGEPDGRPLLNYYPAVIAEREFIQARVGAERRKGRHGPRQGKHVNLFQGLLRHIEDGEGFVVHNRGTAAKPHLVLLSATGKGGRGPCVTFPLRVFEEAILKLLREVPPSELLDRKAGPTALDAAKAAMDYAAAQLEGVRADLAGGYSRLLGEAARQWEGKYEEAKRQVEAEQAKSAHAPEKDWSEFRDLAEALDATEDRDEARLRLQSILRRRVSAIWIRVVPHGRARLLVAQLWFAESDRHRDYAILYQPAANGCEGGWRAKSLAGVTDDDNIDLRDRRQAAALAKVLAAADLVELWARMAK
jgi:DNA invertase Pin-like site-specific DNA recombinase